MVKRFAVSLCGLALVALAGTLGSLTSAQTTDLDKPAPPLLMAGGDSVQIAWSLPEGPKIESMAIYRTTETAPQLIEIGRVEAKQLTFTDTDVRLGQTYQYRVQAFRGVRKSEMSDVVSVLVGGSAGITLLGGSQERVVFEVTLFRGGRQVTERFVHSPGDDVGDLAYVNALQSVEDFRIGPKLVGTELGFSAADSVQHETLKDAEDQPMVSPGGDEIELEFTVPGRQRETLIATLRDADGREFQLREGETWKSE